MSRWTWQAMLVALVTWNGVVAEEPAGITYESLLREMVDRDALARWPAPAYTCKQFSSYDRRSKSPQENWFANADAGQFLREEQNAGRTEWVLMDTEGPGAIVRFWSANPDGAGTVRIYLDGSETPAIETSLADLLGGNWRVGAPLAAIRGRGWNLYLPIPYAKSCKVTADKGKFYYQINYRTYPAGTPVETFSMDVFEKGLSVLRDVTVRLQTVGRDLQPRPMNTIRQDGPLPQEKAVSLRLPPGPRVVRELTVRLRGPDLQTAYRGVVLRMTFDGRETSWCPVGDFYGSGVGVNVCRNWWQKVEADGSMTCYWPMPYEQSATVTLENLAGGPLEYDLTVRTADWTWDDRSMHFHAAWRHEHPLSTEEKKDWNYVEVTGRGVYAGDMLALLNPTTVWWGEGDEKIYVDGESFPSHFGTGTEDYYGYAWGDWRFFQGPFHAQPRVDGPVGLGHTTVFRSRSLDAIPFEKSLRMDMEVWHHRAVEVAYAATTWYYARPGATDNRMVDRKQTALFVPELKPLNKVPGGIEAESLEIVSTSPGVAHEVMGAWRCDDLSSTAQLWFGCKQKGDAVELRAPDALTGPQKVTLHMSRHPDYGIVQVSIDGKPMGEPIDLCNPATEGPKLIVTGPIELGTFEPGPRAPLIRIELVGTNPQAAAPGTNFGFDAIVFEPVASEPE